MTTPLAESSTSSYLQTSASFKGFVRPDGRVGTRNHIGIFVVGNCGATVARKVADHFSAKRLANFPNVDGVVPFIHELGCGMEMTGEPMNLLRRTIAGTIRNPNISGAVVIALGCERNNVRGFFEQENLVTGPLLHMVVMQEVGGTANAIELGIKAVETMLPEINKFQREECQASKLVVGLQSAAPDRLSALSSDPALGAAVDLLVGQGGTVLFSDTSSLANDQAKLTARVASEAVSKQIAQRINWWHSNTAGRDTQLQRDAKATNLDGLSSLARAGTTPIQAAYEYAHPVQSSGLVFMDAPAYAAVSGTGQVASGATLLAVSTGQGTGFGAAAVPTVKLASNTTTFLHMLDDLDIDCGPVAEGDISAQEMGREIFLRWMAYASGEQTKSEELGVGDNEFVPWPIGVLA